MQYDEHTHVKTMECGKGQTQGKKSHRVKTLTRILISYSLNPCVSVLVKFHNQILVFPVSFKVVTFFFFIRILQCFDYFRGLMLVVGSK